MTRRPPKPDLAAGDRVLVKACRWVQGPGGPVWARYGTRWRVVDRVVHDVWAGWQIASTPTAPHHPSREPARHVVAVLRADPTRTERAVPAAAVQLDLFGVAS